MKKLEIFAGLLMMTARVFAVDGQVLINQSTLTAAGGTYTITQAGSYKLSGNLIVPNVNTTAIVIAHDNVTIDLNGFSIIGPVDCMGGFLCGASSAPPLETVGHGIRAGSDTPAQSYFNITIRNGSIHGMGGDAIHILGDSVILEDLHIRSNFLSGILVRSASFQTLPGQANLIVHHCTIQKNGSYGIRAQSGTLTDNTIDQSGSDGISILGGGGGGGLVTHNTVSRSVGFGFIGAGTTALSGNTFVGNNAGLAQVGGGTSLGQNLCNSSVCP